MTMPPISSLRRRGARGATPLAADARPRLSSGVVFEKGPGEATWIAMVHGVPSSRVSRPVVELLTAMNGETALRDLHLRFAASESLETFLHLAQRFRASGLLEGDTKLPPGRLAYRPPFTLQIATLHAPGLFRRLDHLVIRLSYRAVLITVGALLLLGLLAATVQAGELLNVLTTPVPLLGLVMLVAVLSLMTLLHEVAHGLTLTRFGGRPRRAGIMLFYLTPAFFVDVTDGWRLSSRRHRVAVALAGPAVHAVVAAVALLAALVFPQPLVDQLLLLLALSCSAIVLVNLIPFVRFDGYIALMSALDEPNLRVRAIQDGADFLTRILFGGPRMSTELNRWWSVLFGLASLVAPVVLVVFAVARIAQALAGGGPVLGLLVLALEAVVVIVGIVLLARALRHVLRSGVSRLRFVSVGAALVASIAIAGALIPVPLTATLGFCTRGDRVVLVSAGESTEVEVPEGSHVVLESRGILANEQVGRGTVRPQRPRQTTVPLDALFPVKADGIAVPAVIVAGVDLSEESGALPATGQARIELGTRTLWHTLWDTVVTLPLSNLQKEKKDEND